MQLQFTCDSFLFPESFHFSVVYESVKLLVFNLHIILGTSKKINSYSFLHNHCTLLLFHSCLMDTLMHTNSGQCTSTRALQQR
jgi:hypothetical protein